MQIEIKLLSDACMASGEAYNSSIDTDVQFDKYGLPFIAAKRLKGCLRECALELRDWGSKIPIEEMFGEKHDQPAQIQFSDAVLKDHARYVQEIEAEPDKSLVHPQKVLSQFTYLRTQTKIDTETGTALKDSLRVTRVLKHGLVFYANVDIIGSAKEYESYLTDCCKVLRHMGMNRTRGMGEVQVRLLKQKAKKQPKSLIFFNPKRKYTKLDYEISLQTAAVFKSVAGGVTKSVDYIEGGKILGILASRLKGDFVGFMEQGKLICTNAYIQVNGQRALPVSASLVKVKNKSEEGRNRAALSEQKEEAVQLNPVKGGYACEKEDKVYLAEIEKQVRYHHSRPEDKGIGHVQTTEEESQFYQMESICEGQVFAGSIYGSTKQLAKIHQILMQNSSIRLGYGKNAEYGEAEMTITALHEQKKTSACTANRFVVKCNAEVILYNAYGMYSTDVADMQRELEQKLGCSIRISQNYLKYTEIGGYNVTWNTKKPTLLAFDKGTVFVCETEDEITFSDMESVFIGERNSEGYGEISIMKVPEHYEVSYHHAWQDADAQAEIKKITEPSDMMKGIWKAAVKDMVETKANQVAAGMKQALKKEENATAIVNQLLLMQKEYDNEAAFRRTITARFDKDTTKKQHKKAIAEQIIAGENRKTPVQNMQDEIAGCGYKIKVTENEVYEWYYKALLLQLKYYLRRKGV